MPRYIDADTLIEECKRNIKADNERRMAMVDTDFITLVEDAPTVSFASLPFDVEDTVWCIEAGVVFEQEIIEIRKRSDVPGIVCCTVLTEDFEFDASELGKTFFLSRADAIEMITKEEKHEV